LRAVRRHFSDPPENVLKNNVVDTILDSLDIDEAKLSCMVLNHASFKEVLGYVLRNSSHTSSGTMRVVPPVGDSMEAKDRKCQTTHMHPDENQQYKEVHENLYYLLSQVEETFASDKWPGFVLSKEGEEFVEQNAKLFKYDLVYNVSRFESWQNLANLYDEVGHFTI
jgi:calcineurin-binding protein cabin-1